jgi:hypothetical protein
MVKTVSIAKAVLKYDEYAMKLSRMQPKVQVVYQL